MSRTVIMGVDPGLSGAIAFYDPDRPELVLAEDMPVAGGHVDAANLATRAFATSPRVAIVEHAASMPKQGVASVFKFGASYGAVLGVLGALSIPVELVAASRWKKHFRLDSDKEKSRALALQYWPGCAELFRRKKDHGRAEAALLARWRSERAA